MNPDFQHGYNSGLEQVKADTYEGYLSSQVNYDWLTERIAEKRADIQRLDAQVAESTPKRQTTFDALQTHLLNISTLAKQVGRLETDRKAIETEQADLAQRRRQSAPDYSLLAGLLFLAAGISFLAGDLIISHEIVAYALNIRDNTEAWAFAVGLAMVSILLKPVYDRLIEGPYQTDPVKNATRYQRFKVTLAVFSVLTLIVLGWFRYEAYRTDQLKSAINKSIKNLQLNAPLDASGNPVPLTPAVMRQIEKQLQDSDSLNLDLVNSPWALLSFVLSGVLFALAGAVCLGIALPVLQAFWFRWLQVDPRRWRLRRRMKRLTKQLLPMEQTLTEQITRKAVLEHELDRLPAVDDLKRERKMLTDEINNLLNESRLAQTDSRIATYNDGYAKGEVARDTMTDEAFQQAQRDYSTLGSPDNRLRSGTDERVVRGRVRPHEAIRQVISDGVNPS
ncbi:MAG: hypothetical protein H7Z72_00125 [Bacteroidetes bacterium]|nr:hypothetical protein [Fibrella sp.]